MNPKILRLAALFPFLLALDGCAPTDANGNGDDGGQKFGALSLFDPAPSPGNGTIVPFPFDGLFAGFTDPTLNIPNGATDSNVPFVTAANKIDGFSTTASIFTDLTGFVDYSTAAAALLVYKCTAYSTSGPTTGACINATRLTAGTDYLVQSSPATDAATNIPINKERSRLLIEPLHPLAPSTRYFVAVTSDLKSTDGVSATASDIYRVTASATPVSSQTAPVLASMSAQQKGTLEVLRSQLIRPGVQLLTALSGKTEDQLILTWSFTTESTGKTLQALNAAAVARPIGMAFTGLNASQVNPALTNKADIWAGTFTTPYYLQKAANNHDTAPLTGFWLADANQPDTNASFLAQVPCGAFYAHATLPTGTAQPSVSTTVCFPIPVKQSDATIPVLMTVPNANSGLTKPANGWPVVIFQHGITGDRSNMLGIGPTLATAGFVTVAIDLPLHGITNTGSPLYAGAAERTFNLDLMSNTTGAAGPDGIIDGSGSWFINLASLLTSRDNLRQAVSDLINLSKSVSSINLDGNAATQDIDPAKIYFVGHSLGGIVGGTLLGVNTDIHAATLAMPGGGLGKLLDASKAFGPRISAGLAASGVVEGSDNYETFIRFAQQAVDPGDPINFAASASANHSIHMIEVINDLVVPNSAPANDGTGFLDKVTIAGYLSGTAPLYQEMGLAVTGPVTPPLAVTAGGPNTVVQFASGTAGHSTLLTPDRDSTSGNGNDTDFLCSFEEMQSETASFFVADGAGFQLGRSCP